MKIRRGANLRATDLLSTEHTELVDEGGRFSRVERTAQIATHPQVQRSLRVCWRNPGGAYNCGRCNKCLLTMVPLEVLGARDAVATFPPELDLDAVAAIEVDSNVAVQLWRTSWTPHAPTAARHRRPCCAWSRAAGARRASPRATARG